MNEFCKYDPVYTTEQTELIASEFKRLQGQHYLDHAGATLYSEKQLNDIFSNLSQNIYGNPHSKNLSSKTTDDTLDVIRFQILHHFNTNPEEYSVIFTSGATAALKLLAETFNYENGGQLVYLQDNHTSVLGMRHYNPNFRCLPIDPTFELLSKHTFQPTTPNPNPQNSLFVYPAQSNFSGTKYPASWPRLVQNGALHATKHRHNWYVCIDAAATSSLDLAATKPDFVALSFYKIFGYPTGLGALLVRKSSGHVLAKGYFGGGSVQMALSAAPTVVFRDSLQGRFEDGTVAFLAVAAVRHGCETWRRLKLNGDLVATHTFALAKYVYRNLACWHHSNGAPVARLYHQTIFERRTKQGGIVNFNLVRENGELIGYTEVEHFAGLFGVHLRTGCFCNPGACQHFLQMTDDDVKRNFQAGHVCGDKMDLVNGRPTGSVRVSFGYMSTKADADRFLEMVESCFVQRPMIRKIPKSLEAKRFDKIIVAIENGVDRRDSLMKKAGNVRGKLAKICLYPVKSCAAFSVATKWPLNATGLKYDREWMIVNSSGVCVTQKHNKLLCLIRPLIDLDANTLTLTYFGHGECVVALKAPKEAGADGLCHSKVCGDKILGWDCGDQVAAWLCDILQCPGLRLLKQCVEEEEDNFPRSWKKSGEPALLSLVNQAQYLLVNRKSVEWLQARIPQESEFRESLDLTVDRFRANLIVDFDDSFVENDCDSFRIDNLEFQSGGKCTRCQMICIDQTTGKATKEPLHTLAREFKGRISFGVYLNRNVYGRKDDVNFLAIGSTVFGIKSLE